MTLVDPQLRLFDGEAPRQGQDEAPGALGPLAAFHPAVAAWFSRRFPEGPTPPQSEAWPAIAARLDTLVAAPTGSGKTLSAFLVAIDQLYRAHDAGVTVSGATHVVYVSPLRALAVDIKENLEGPLAEIAEEARRLGYEPPPLTVAVRTGDTTASARAAILRRPPSFLVTTPESLYLLVTSARSRQLLRTVSTVIVDEIHALARDKRGSHLALTLERLDHVCTSTEEPPVLPGAPDRPTRVGLSATQRPIETIARFLVGAERPCQVVDCGHQRALDLQLELPEGELEALMSGGQMAEVVDRIAGLVTEHRTTLVFVNTRRLAERLAHQLGERLGEDVVCAHHGSLSKDRRLRVEHRLRQGELRALVATASLELGIDIGPVDLVCQIGSPRALATLLQRVGRSGHTRWGTPKGRVFPLSRDELVETAALLAGVRAGRLDALHPPVAPLDILAQQLVAETAAQEWDVDGLYALVRRASPYAELRREDFDRTLAFMTEGVMTGRGRRAAHIHHDRTNGELRARRGARLAALTSGGAIPELADYRVVAEPDDTFVGTVNEDWAIESLAGDVFLLGTHTWRIRRVENGVVRVVDAEGADPTIPFWLGEAPGRTTELSEEVSRLRSVVDAHLAAGDAVGAVAWLGATCGIDEAAAEMIVEYLAAGRAVLGLVPTRQDLVIERFFDESGGMQLVVHSPYGSRLNRGFGLALRKRFCVTFDFELQAAANDDALVLSLGPHHSFPLDDVARFLRAATVAEVLQQAVLVPPFAMFTSRWRWNLNRSLTVLRWKGGRRNPPAIQRMESDDLMAAVFPSAAACQENAAGPLEVPDHPLVRQTLHDTMTEALDLEGLEALLEDIEAGRVTVHTRDTAEPSPLCHELLSGRPYTFLDDAPAEERRTRAVTLRRGLPVDASELGQVDPAAVERVRGEVRPDPRSPDELADLLASVVLHPAVAEWQDAFDALAARRRAVAFEHLGARWWAGAEQAPAVAALLPGAVGGVDGGDRETAALQAVRGWLETTGPVTKAWLVDRLGIGEGTVAIALAALESEGFALRGSFTAPTAEPEWCARRLLQRIHVYSQKRRRREIEPVSTQDFVRFLLRWQHLAPGTRLRGPEGLLAAVEQLQGWEAPAGAWEAQLLGRRVEGYRPSLLDQRCHAGDVAWARLALPGGAGGSDGEAPTTRMPSRATPISLCARADLDWLLVAHRGAAVPDEPATGPLAEVLEALRRHGARFHRELAADTGRLPGDVEVGLWDGVARGLLTADGFHAVRSLLDARQSAALDAAEPVWRRRRRTARRGTAGSRAPGEGRWALVPAPPPVEEPDELAEAVAEQLLARWGVVWRDLAARERLALPWRDVLWALRRLEARGLVRGGRFVTSASGEQFALPEAVQLLNQVRRAPCDGEVVVVSAVDPLNLTGGLIPGPRQPALGNRTITLRDGLLV